MKTKEKILLHATSLFNDKGVDQITTRDIAADMHISQGNLHYHYPKKDVLLRALFEQFREELKTNSLYVEGTFFDKDMLFQSITANYTLMYAYRFLFKDKDIIWRRVPEIEREMLDIYTAKKEGFSQIVSDNQSRGIFRKNITKKQLEFLVDQIILTITSWITAAPFLGNDQPVVDFFAEYTFRLWIPYLADDQLISWEDTLNK